MGASTFDHYGAEVIHVERVNGWDDHRYNARLPTVITSSLTLEELERQDPSLSSRLVDRSRCRHVALEAPAYRGGGGPTKSRGRRKR